MCRTYTHRESNTRTCIRNAKRGRRQNENVMNVIQFIKLLNGVKWYNVIKTRHLHNIYGHIHIHIFHHYNFELIFPWLHFFSTFTSLLLCQTSATASSQSKRRMENAARLLLVWFFLFLRCYFFLSVSFSLSLSNMVNFFANTLILVITWEFLISWEFHYNSIKWRRELAFLCYVARMYIE